VTHGKIIVGDILIVMLAVIAGGGFDGSSAPVYVLG
jgi:hypothetical protein